MKKRKEKKKEKYPIVGLKWNKIDAISIAIVHLAQ